MQLKQSKILMSQIKIIINIFFIVIITVSLFGSFNGWKGDLIVFFLLALPMITVNVFIKIKVRLQGDKDEKELIGFSFTKFILSALFMLINSLIRIWMTL